MRTISRMTAFFLSAAIVLTGCNTNSNENPKDITKEEPQTDMVSLCAEEAKRTEVIIAGGDKIYLDEVRYYAYNTQATYEAYYMAEGKELDWNREIQEGITLEEAVKSTLLDTICEREAIVTYANEYGITFTENELMEVSEKVDKFYSDTNENLLAKTDVERKRLKEIFEKDALYKKVKKKMDKKESGKSEETYKNWKKANNVTTNEYWNAINFQTPILEE